MSDVKTISVLLVDDEEGFRNAATAVLKRRGFNITAVAGGAEALEEIRKGKTDVVILDIKMPEMDGHETFREIEKLHSDIQVIMLTGHGSADSALEDLHEGVFDSLAKPCDIDLLIEKIHQAFARKELHVDRMQDK